MRSLRRHLTYANVTVTIALFVALGGTSYAAFSLPAGSVGTKQIKNGAVTKAKLAHGLQQGAVGPQGPAGPAGATGPEGPPGPATEATLAPAEPWHEIGSAGNPGFDTCSVFPSEIPWENNRPDTDATAAFYRDPYGVVHLKGSVKCSEDPGPGYTIFRLPPGYFPSKIQWWLVPADNGPVTIVAENYGTRADVIYLNGQRAGDRISLDGISWRCSPSGVDGCP